MNHMLLAAPALLPLAGGAMILAAESWKKDSGRGKNIDGSGVESDHWLEICVQGLTLTNSLIIAALIIGRFGIKTEQELVLFRLFGNLKVLFRLDAMGSVFAGLIACLWPLAALYSFEYMKNEERKHVFYAFYLMTYGVTAGIAFAGNLVTLYLFYELLTLVTFPLVLYPMTREAVRASRTYLYYSIGGAAFAFIGLVFVLSFSVTSNTDFIPGGVLNLQAAQTRRNLLLFVYVLAFFGFGVKAALFPCHGWLPMATVAPTPVTALLHAVAVVKSGAFAILRLTYYSFGIEFLQGSPAQWVVLTAALATIVYGSTMAVREVHWKRRLAYSTISNLSYILFGAALMSPLGLVAALSHLTAHAFMKICSFFCAGAVMHQTGKSYVYELDGLGRQMPVTFACLTIASLSLMGIPLFAGFISKWNLAQAAFEQISLGQAALNQTVNQQTALVQSDSALIQGAGSSWLALAGVGVILYSALMTGIYMLTVLIHGYFPTKKSGGCAADVSQESVYSDPGWRMQAPLVIFAVVIVLLGLNFRPFLKFLMAIGGDVG